jgi:hypothetical protein
VTTRPSGSQILIRRSEPVNWDPQAVLAASATPDGLAAAAGQSAFATLDIAGTFLLSRHGRTKTITPLPRADLVDELLAEIEAFENAPQPENPFDASQMVEAQQQLALDFGKRLPRVGLSGGDEQALRL